jgi:hypothetical protein
LDNSILYISRLKLSIESFLIAACTNDQYDIAVLPQTTIKDLKQIVGINKTQMAN